MFCINHQIRPTSKVLLSLWAPLIKTYTSLIISTRIMSFKTARTAKRPMRMTNYRFHTLCPSLILMVIVSLIWCWRESTIWQMIPIWKYTSKSTKMASKCIAWIRGRERQFFPIHRKFPWLKLLISIGMECSTWSIRGQRRKKSSFCITSFKVWVRSQNSYVILIATSIRESLHTTQMSLPIKLLCIKSIGNLLSLPPHSQSFQVD